MERYSRQMRFQPIGMKGQQRLARARVCVIGAGALGSSSSEMLVRAGVKELTIIDRDILEMTNLHRQQLYTEQDVNDHLPKAVAAEKRLQAINQNVKVSGIVADISTENVIELINHYDIIVDGTDNMETRLLVNDAAQKLSIPFFMGAVVSSYGITFPIGVKNHQPCLHCLIDTIPAEMMTCDSIGVISPIVVTVAARQVADILKYIVAEPFEPKLTSTDIWTNEHASIVVQPLRKENCPSCGVNPTYPFLTAKHAMKHAVLCGRDTVQLSWPTKQKIDLTSFVKNVTPIVQNLMQNPYLVSCEYEQYRIVLFCDGRMLIHGTKDPTTARRIAASLVG